PSPATTTRATPAAVGNAVFPTAVTPKYSNQPAGKARMATCLDQYKTNKANNANGGLKWIQKGGGYYSECSKRLKSKAGWWLSCQRVAIGPLFNHARCGSDHRDAKYHFPNLLCTSGSRSQPRIVGLRI